MLISIGTLIKKYQFTPHGIIHIGAHLAEECENYAIVGVQEVLWIEGNPKQIDKITRNIAPYPGNKVANELLSDRDGQKVEFNITNHSMSSSLLPLGLHSTYYPDIKVESKIELATNRFDTYARKAKLTLSKYDFINIDIQGSELFALKGFGDLLDDIKYIYTEVNIAHLYESCPLLDEMDEYLGRRGFKRMELSLTERGWGDAFYVRGNPTEAEINSLVTEAQNLIKQFAKKSEESKPKSVAPKTIWRKIKDEIKRTKKKLVYFINKKSKTPEIVSEGVNLSLQMIQNEETALLERLVSTSNETDYFTLLDVGANAGKYTDEFLEICKKYNQKYKAHLFEPQKSLYDLLKEKYKDNKNIVVNNFGCSDIVSQAPIFKDEDASSQASMYKRSIFNHEHQEEMVRLTTLSSYIQEHNLGRIDLLKIDVEGHEHKVLTGAKEAFPTIRHIQFEYGGTYQDAGIRLKDVYDLLRPEFYIGKIDQSIDYTPYFEGLEDFNYSNYFAANRRLKMDEVLV